MNKPRCPMDFKNFCGSQCAWYNQTAKRCWLLEEVSDLSATLGRLTSTVDNNNKILDGVAKTLLSLVKEKRDELSR